MAVSRKHRRWVPLWASAQRRHDAGDRSKIAGRFCSGCLEERLPATPPAAVSDRSMLPIQRCYFVSVRDKNISFVFVSVRVQTRPYSCYVMLVSLCKNNNACRFVQVAHSLAACQTVPCSKRKGVRVCKNWRHPC